MDKHTYAFAITFDDVTNFGIEIINCARCVRIRYSSLSYLFVIHLARTLPWSPVACSRRSFVFIATGPHVISLCQYSVFYLHIITWMCRTIDPCETFSFRESKQISKFIGSMSTRTNQSGQIMCHKRWKWTHISFSFVLRPTISIVITNKKKKNDWVHKK